MSGISSWPPLLTLNVTAQKRTGIMIVYFLDDFGNIHNPFWSLVIRNFCEAFISSTSVNIFPFLFPYLLDFLCIILFPNSMPLQIDYLIGSQFFDFLRSIGTIQMYNYIPFKKSKTLVFLFSSSYIWLSCYLIEFLFVLASQASAH